MSRISIAKIGISFVLGLLILPASQVWAQDIHFSQYSASPLTLNPAMTGDFDGEWRLANSYRDQWRSIARPMTTNAFSFEKQFYLHTEQISGGLLVVNDQSGDAQLTVNALYLSAAYHRKLGRSTMSIGFQPGYVMKFYKTDDLTFPEQYDHSIGYFNGSLESGESNYRQQLGHFDLNFGLSWKMDLPRITPRAGVALFHLLDPKESFFRGEQRQGIRQSIFADITIQLDEHLFLRPAVQYSRHSIANSAVPGSDIGYQFKQEREGVNLVYGGVYYRSGFTRNEDAIIPVVGFGIQRWNIGMSYDVNISGLEVATENRGGFEISIRYTSFSTALSKTTIPCERY